MTTKILTCPDYQHVLHRPSNPVSTLKTQELLSLISTMRLLMRRSNGLGLSAPQIGVHLRLFITSWGETFINPVVSPIGDRELCEEGCLSLPNQLYRVPRHGKVKVGDTIYTGVQAQVIQHEVDHLNGILISDIGELVLT